MAQSPGQSQIIADRIASPWTGDGFSIPDLGMRGRFAYHDRLRTEMIVSHFP